MSLMYPGKVSALKEMSLAKPYLKKSFERSPTRESVCSPTSQGLGSLNPQDCPGR